MTVVRKGSDGLYNLDQRDRLLLSLLQSDSELSMSSIGDKLNLTKMAVSNRIKSLKKTGIIMGSHYRIDPQKIGQDYLLVCQVTCDVSGPEQEKVAGRIAKIPGVQTVYLNFGPSDILFIARRRDKQAAKNLLYDVSRIPGIRNTLTTIPHTVVKETLELQLDS